MRIESRGKEERNARSAFIDKARKTEGERRKREEERERERKEKRRGRER